MTNQDKSNHWDLLAGELGADPSPEEPKEEPVCSAEELEEPAVPAPERIAEEAVTEEVDADACDIPKSAFDDLDPSAEEVVEKAPVADVLAAKKSKPKPAGEGGWDQLADDLGIEVAVVPERAKTPVADVPAAKKPARRSKSKPAKPKAGGSSWDQLADDLGIEVAVAPERSKTPVAEEPVAEEPVEAVCVERSPDEIPFNAFGDLDVEVEEEAEAEASAIDEEAVGDEQATKRPSRRRRKRSRKPREEKPPVSDEVANVDDVAEPLEGEVDGEPFAEELEETVEEEEREQPRRGRHRGSRRRKKTVASETVASEETQNEEDAVLEEDADLETTPVAAPAERTIHRSIPTWDEAIGLIVASNLESRSKRSGGGTSRGRGTGGSSGGGRKPRESSGSGQRTPRKRRR